jgi:hypothetical protein
MVPAALLATHSAPLPGLRTAIQLVLLVYAGSRLCGVIASTEVKPVTGFFWLFTYVALGVAPLAQITTNVYQRVQDFDQLIPATLLILFGCIAFDVGHRLPVPARQADRPATSREPRTVTHRRLVVLSVLGIVASLYYISKTGGPSDFFASREHLSQQLELATHQSDPSNPLLLLLQAAGQVPILIAFLCWTVRLSSGRPRQLADWCWWLSLGLLNVVVNNPVSNSRFWFLTVFVSILLVRPRLTARTFRAILVLGAVAAVLVFPYADYFRYGPEQRHFTYARSSLVETFAGKDYDQMTMTANGIWWIHARGGHTYGRQLLGAALFWFPRSMWSGKPLDTGVTIGTDMQLPSEEINLSSPLWLEAWVDFGWIGTFVALLALGVFARRADAAFDARRRRPGTALTAVGLVVPLIAGYELILLRGPLLQAMAYLTAMLAVTWFVTARPRPAAVEARERLQIPGGTMAAVAGIGRRPAR